jgi:hypothetical protein
MILNKESSPNDWADFWRNECGLNVIPADTKNKKIYERWSLWQKEGISKEQHQEWKERNAFDNGIAIIAGNIWHKKGLEKYSLCFIDLDNQKAIEEICTIFGTKDLNQLAQRTIVEQHRDNPSKAHVYFYTEYILKKKSSDATRKLKDKLDSNEIPAIEVKCQSDGLAYCTPSLHKDGYNYEITGVKEIAIFDGKEIEDKLFEIYKKFRLLIEDCKSDDVSKIPIEDLFNPEYIIKEGHNRSEAVMRVFESLYARYGNTKSIETIRQEMYNWMIAHCDPPLDQDKFEKQLKDGRNFVDRTATQEPGNVLQQLLKIDNEKELIYKIVDYNIPYKAYYIDEKLCQICYGKLTENGIIPLKSIINIIPKKLIYYYNPYFPKDKPKVALEFTIRNEARTIGPVYSSIELLKELEDKNHVLTKSKAADAFSSVISAMNEKEGLVEHTRDVTNSGYYLIDGNLVMKEITQSTEPVTKDDVIECCNLLNSLSSCWKNKDILPTVLKWGLLAPFSFIIKSNSDKYMPWLQLFGQGQSGKTTLGLMTLQIWNKPTTLKKGFNNIDSPARFGETVSQDTYPTVVNEVGSLYETGKYRKYSGITEMIKHSIESISGRSKFYDPNNHQEIPALSPFILTANYAPPNEGGFGRRFISIHFPKDEKKDVDEQKSFDKLLDEKKQYLKVLGDFTMQYISKDPTVLLKVGWIDISEKILKEFYRFAEMDIPEWIEYFVEQKDAVDESNEQTTFSLRAFFVNKINELYSRHRIYNAASSYPHNDNQNNVTESENHLDDLRKKLVHCIDNKLITFIHRYKKEGEIVITRDIVEEINNSTLGRIENITGLEDIGDQIGLKYRPREFNGKKTRVLLGDLDILYKFLDPRIF